MESDAQPPSRRRAAIFISTVAIAVAMVAMIRVAGGESGNDSDGMDMLPSVELTAGEDSTLSTDDLIGGPLVMNFWYSACPPCANELKDFAAVHSEYGDRVRFVGVNAIDTVDEMTAFAAERGVTYELFQDRLAELQDQLRLTSFPTTLFIASDGSIVTSTGVLDQLGLENEVRALLAADS